MREIKFRAWYQGEMIEVGTMAYFEDGTVIVNDELVGCKLMQYTGLKDKNGKEIYEGDIVEWAGYQGLVRWVFLGKEMERGTPDRIGSWYFNNGYVVDLDNGKYPDDDENPEWVNLDDKYEITGNIYENPELL